jgi:hypothetical protein
MLPHNLKGMLCPMCKQDSLTLNHTEGQIDILNCKTEDCPLLRIEVIHGWLYPYRWTTVEPSQGT